MIAPHWPGILAWCVVVLVTLAAAAAPGAWPYCLGAACLALVALTHPREGDHPDDDR